MLSEGRDYLSQIDRRYDVIQLSGVDTFSGTVASAHVFSENYLYTLEAFELFLSRLTDDGILNLMRLEHDPPRPMFRALITGFRALKNAGMEDPARHIIMISALDGGLSALLLK